MIENSNNKPVPTKPSITDPAIIEKFLAVQSKDIDARLQ